MHLNSSLTNNAAYFNLWQVNSTSCRCPFYPQEVSLQPEGCPSFFSLAAINNQGQSGAQQKLLRHRLQLPPQLLSQPSLLLSAQGSQQKTCQVKFQLSQPFHPKMMVSIQRAPIAQMTSSPGRPGDSRMRCAATSQLLQSLS